MSFIGLKVPHETARLLGGLDVPGTREPVSSLHVTMFYFGDGLSIDQLTEIIRVTFQTMEGSKPFTVRTSQITSFPKGESGSAPVICRVESDALHDLRDRMKEAYDAEGVEYSNNYPDYKPHVTLAYYDGDFEERRITTVEWGAHELVLWGGDSGDDTLVTHFPFASGDLEKLAAKVAQRFQGVRP